MASGRRERQLRAQGYGCVAGTDEAGRGAWFGPVFAAAVILNPDRAIRGLRDSKQLAPARRAELAHRIRERALAWAVAGADVYEVDHLNILQASRLAMQRAVRQLRPACDYLLIDACQVDWPVPQESIIHGDATCQCIAAASILAKTARDECMEQWDAVFPEYGFAKHKGYGTEEHQAALLRYGPTTLHRHSFEPVRQLLNSRAAAPA